MFKAKEILELQLKMEKVETISPHQPKYEITDGAENQILVIERVGSEWQIRSASSMFMKSKDGSITIIGNKVTIIN